MLKENKLDFVNIRDSREKIRSNKNMKNFKSVSSKRIKTNQIIQEINDPIGSIANKEEIKHLEKEEEFDKKEFYFGMQLIKNKKNEKMMLDYDNLNPKLCAASNRAEFQLDVNLLKNLINAESHIDNEENDRIDGLLKKKDNFEVKRLERFTKRMESRLFTSRGKDGRNIGFDSLRKKILQRTRNENRSRIIVKRNSVSARKTSMSPIKRTNIQSRDNIESIIPNFTKKRQSVINFFSAESKNSNTDEHDIDLNFNSLKEEISKKIKGCDEKIMNQNPKSKIIKRKIIDLLSPPTNRMAYSTFSASDPMSN